jgi:multidrug resistance protein, MATE family
MKTAGKLTAMLRREDLKCFIVESWSVSWPMTLIMFFEFLTGLTDIYIAGRIGKEVQAAYGFVIQLYFVFFIIGNALTVGAVSVISRIFTSGDRRELSHAVNSSIISAVAAGLLFGAAGVLFTPGIIGLANIPADLKPFAISLGRIYAAGLVFQCFLINSNGILRACKQVKDSLRTMCVVCIANILLNFLLALHSPLGYRGIAMATMASVCIGSLINLYSIRPLLTPFGRFSTAIAKRIIAIGWPSGLLQALWQFSAMAIYLILSTLPKNSVEILAALATGLRIESAIFLPAFAFNMANAVIVGNLLGEKKEDDAFRGGIVTALMGVLIVAFLTVAVILNARWIAPLLAHNSIVVAESIKYIYISMLSEPFMAWGIILGGGLNGAGDTKGVMIIVTLSAWLVRIPLAAMFVLFFGMGAVSVWWTMNLSQLVMALFLTRRYFRREWLVQS